MKTRASLTCRRALVFASLVAVGGAATAADPVRTHCSPSEHVLFSCELEKGKTVSLCATSNLTSMSGTFQYRIGHVRKAPELSYPKQPIDPRQEFSLSPASPPGQWVQRELTFVHQGFSYGLRVYSNAATAEYEATVVASKLGKLVFYEDCKPSNVLDNTWQLDALNLPTTSNKSNRHPDELP